jgi:hypothetical protein
MTTLKDDAVFDQRASIMCSYFRARLNFLAVTNFNINNVTLVE